jgi:hypothetical protein
MTKPEFPGPGLSADQWRRIDALAADLTLEQAIWISGFFAGLGHSARGAGKMVPGAARQAPPIAAASPASTSRTLTVLFGSETGNSAGLARSLADAATAQGIAVQLFDMADYKPRRLKEEHDLLVITTTHGEGDPPGEIERRLGFPLGEARPFKLTSNGDPLGWVQGEDGRWHYTLFVENGRIANTADCAALDGLREIAHIHKGTFRVTPNQNLIVSEVATEDRPGIEAALKAYGLDAEALSGLRRNAMACVALPTCGLTEDPITIRMTGCPNGCARPYIAEIGLTGRALGKYNLISAAARTASGSTRRTSRTSERRRSWQPSTRSSGTMRATVAKESPSAILPSAQAMWRKCGKAADLMTDMSRSCMHRRRASIRKLSLVFELRALALAGGPVPIAGSQPSRSSHGRSRVRRHR